MGPAYHKGGPMSLEVPGKSSLNTWLDRASSWIIRGDETQEKTSDSPDFFWMTHVLSFFVSRKK